MSKIASVKVWIKTNTWPFIAGVVVALILLPSQFGWYTAGGAEKLATERVNTALVLSLTPGCVIAAQAQPELMARLSKETSSYARERLIGDANLANDPNGKLFQDIATACAAKLKITPAG